MARKKVIKKRVSRKVSSKKFKLKLRRIEPKDKIRFVFNQLLFFVGLCLVSLLLYKVVTNVILMNLFSVLAMISGFIAVGFLIAILILLIKKAIKK
jgi:hypothetical protein